MAISLRRNDFNGRMMEVNFLAADQNSSASDSSVTRRSEAPMRSCNKKCSRYYI